MTLSLNLDAPTPTHRASDLISLTTAHRRAQPRLWDIALRISVPLAILAIWHLSSTLGWVNARLLAPPLDVWSTFLSLSQSGILWINLQASLQRAAMGFAFGLGVALPLALVAGLSRLGDQLVDPSLQMLRTIPFLAITPLLIVWFGIYETQKIVLISLACGIPFYMNAYSGFRNIDPKLLELARVYGVSKVEQIVKIVLPGAIPQMLVGLRLSIGIAMLALIVAEQTNAPRGIGALILGAQNNFQTDILLVCILIYACWGIIGDTFVRVLEVVLMPWRRRFRENKA